MIKHGGVAGPGSRGGNKGRRDRMLWSRDTATLPIEIALLLLSFVHTPPIKGLSPSLPVRLFSLRSSFTPSINLRHSVSDIRLILWTHCIFEVVTTRWNIVVNIFSNPPSSWTRPEGIGAFHITLRLLPDNKEIKIQAKKCCRYRTTHCIHVAMNNCKYRL